jgi:hypothetical protein
MCLGEKNVSINFYFAYVVIGEVYRITNVDSPRFPVVACSSLAHKRKTTSDKCFYSSTSSSQISPRCIGVWILSRTRMINQGLRRRVRRSVTYGQVVENTI